nr:biotin--[acetyl-CoA-carboxylase] ligase [Sphingomonas jaspsi]
MRIVERTGSTNSDLLARTDAVEGDWLVALAQDAGRGRHNRHWQSLDGNFFGSTLVQLRPGDPEAPSLALVAGLALIEAVEHAAPAAPLSLKWPNDLMRGDAKLAGILLERSGDRVVAGFGVNMAVQPEVEGRKTASLSDLCNLTPQAFAPLLAGSFARLLGAWRMAEPSALAKAWEAKAHPVGTPLTVHSGPDERTSGIFDGLEQDGAMRLCLADGKVEIVRVGDVSLG